MFLWFLVLANLGGWWNASWGLLQSGYAQWLFDSFSASCWVYLLMYREIPGDFFGVGLRSSFMASVRTFFMTS